MNYLLKPSGVLVLVALELRLAARLLTAGSSSASAWFAWMYSPEAIRKPHVPAAGSQITSPGVGAVISTIKLDDVARRAELAVLAGRRDLGEEVLVDVALGVAVLHRDLVDEVDRLGEERGGRDRETGVAHMPRVCGAVAAEGPQEREHVLAHDRVHVGRSEVLEVRPAVVGEDAPLGVGACGEHRRLNRFAEAVGLVLLERLDVVEALEEEQVSDLFHDLQRVGDPPDQNASQIRSIFAFTSPVSITSSSGRVRLRGVPGGYLRARRSFAHARPNSVTAGVCGPPCGTPSRLAAKYTQVVSAGAHRTRYATRKSATWRAPRAVPDHRSSGLCIAPGRRRP